MAQETAGRRADEAGLGPLMLAGDVPAARPVAPAPAGGRPARVRSLSVVMPARNEVLGLPDLLRELDAVLEGMDQLEFREVVVVDDGSHDGTGETAAARGARVVRHHESLGNGAAVKRGIREARGEWILLLDGDGQHPPGAIPAMLELAGKYEMVVGSRGGRGGSLHRNLANRIYNALASYVSGRRIPDLTSGFRLVRADLAKDMVYLLPNTFSYPSTLTLALLRAGWSVGFHPIAVRPRQGRSHVRLFADGSRFVLIILRIATFFAPLRVFLPLSALVFAAGIGWYLYTYLTQGRLTNMAVVLVCQATVLFALGLISEQVAALRYQRMERGDDRG
jgi:glycosyltransferase involved in cell wall biosynthesis